MCSRLHLCVCVSACVVLRIVAAPRQPLCSSEHMVSDTSLSSAILSVYTASRQPRQKSFLLRLKARLKENMDEHEWKFIPRLMVLDSTDEDGFKKWIHFKGEKKKESLGLRLTFS